MKKNMYFALALSIILLSCSNSDKPVTPNSSGFTVSGRVTLDGNALQGVAVTDGTRSSVTDNDGKYTIADVPVGAWVITASKSGYFFAPDSQSVTISNVNLSDKNFTAAEVKLSDFTRCVLEVHGIVFEETKTTIDVIKPRVTETIYDTINFSFSAKRNLSDRSVMLFDTVSAQNGDYYSTYIKVKSLLIKLNILDRLQEVTYQERLRLHTSTHADWQAETIDSTVMSFGPVLSGASYTYRISGSALLQTSILNMFNYRWTWGEPTSLAIETRFVRYKLLPDAEVVIRLLR